MVTRNLFAAVWRVKTARSASLSLIQKGVEITNAMEKAFAYMQSASHLMKAVNPVYLFAAPEYYWVKAQMGEKISLYSQAEKETIYEAMRSTSGQLQNLIMFPGTVNWSIPRADHTGTPTAINRDLVGFNSAPVYLNGVQVLNYFKKFNDRMLDNEQNGPASFSAGPADGTQSFRANGLHFGLDICGDLNDGKLSQTLGDEKVDVMVLISGSMAHHFGESQLYAIPVKQGGAFVHADNRGVAERNGLWVITPPGQGWHGSHRVEDSLTFQDLDNKQRKIGFPKADKIPGTTFTVTPLAGFRPGANLQATGVVKGGGWVRKFTLVLPGSGRTQTAVVEKPQGQDYKVTLTRRFSSTKVRANLKAESDSDIFGMETTGRGNVSKIGKIPPGPDDDDLDCYTVPINSLN